jgi:hypothetical protein
MQPKINNISHKKAQEAQKGIINTLRILCFFAANT